MQQGLTAPAAHGVRHVFGVLRLVVSALAWQANGGQAHVVDPTACEPSIRAEAFARTELFFGLSRPGGVITDAQFQRFLDEQVTPRFPAGLTVLAGHGQFRDGGKVVLEGARLLILLVPRSERDASAKVEQIRAAYRKQFEQHSVLRADEPSCVSF